MQLLLYRPARWETACGALGVVGRASILSMYRPLSYHCVQQIFFSDLVTTNMGNLGQKHRYINGVCSMDSGLYHS